jgi:hypothetical protein
MSNDPLKTYDGHDAEPTENATPTVSHPQRIGSYQILEVLGEGGMGLVCLADQREPVRRRVAIKLNQLDHERREVRIVAIGVKDRTRLLVAGEEVTL